MRKFLCLLLVGYASDLLGQINIVEPDSYRVDDGPNHFQTGDFNEDGFVDIVTVNADPSSENLSILINDLNGGFDDRLDIALSDTPYEVAIEDVNTDGHLDIVVTIRRTDEVGVLLGDGDGNFGTPTYFTTGADTAPYGISLADIDSDNFIDIITANRDGDNISILTGDGLGSFSAPTQILTGNSPWDIVTDFFNSDGFIDLAVVNTLDENIVVLFGDGTGGFPSSITIPSITDDIDFLEIADLNGDGNKDIVGMGTGLMMTLLGSGTGSFSAPTFYNYCRGRGNAGDLEGDGNIDIVFYTNGNALYTMKGDGTGDFEYDVKYYFNNSGPNSGSEIIDVDNDGDNDIISLGSAATITMNRITILKNNGAGNFDAPTMYPLLPISGNIEGAYALVSNDFNEDGFADIAAVNHEEDHLALLFGNGMGQFTLPNVLPTGNDPRDIVTGDIDNDGHQDILTFNWVSDDITSYRGDGAGSFTILGSIATISTALAFDIADVNEDNNLDILVANGSGNSVSIFTGNGAGSFSTAGILSTSAAVNDVKAGDFNDDGFIDLAVSMNASDEVIIFIGNGSGGFSELATYNTFGAGTLETGDLNGDGNIDLLIGTTNPVSGSALILIGAGDGTFSGLTVEGISGTTIHHLFAEDMNGDGQSELIRGSQSPGSVLGAGTVSANGLDSSLDRVTEMWEGGSVGGWKILIEDFNQDGLPDIASVDVNFNGIWILTNNSVAACTPPTITGNTSIVSTLCEGEDTTLSITASGDPPSYSWFKDGSPISGANTNSLMISDINTSDAGDYLVEVVNACGTDQLSFSVTVNTVPSDPTVTNGSGCANTSITLEASGSTDGNYRWYDVATGGTALSGEVNGSFNTPALSVSTSYYVSISENGCESSRSEVVATVINEITITSQPSDQTLEIGQTAVFSIMTTGDNPMYQWQKEGVDIATETSNSLTLANVMISDEGNYTCLVGNSCNSILSDVATLEIIDPSSGFSVTDGIQNLQINNAQQTAIEFDPAVAGVTSSRTFIINNTGQTTITISNILLTGDMVFSLGPIPSQVDVGSSESFEVISESQVAGLFNASVIIESNIGSFTFPITVQFTDPPVNRALLVYNAVAPNGNGKHDFLKIENIESTANNSVQIFSRWGDKVYEASGYDNETTRFEGKGNVGSAGELTEGTYFYVIKTETEELTGFLFLRR